MYPYLFKCFTFDSVKLFLSLHSTKRISIFYVRLHCMAHPQSILHMIIAWQVHKDGIASTQGWNDQTSESELK